MNGLLPQGTATMRQMTAQLQRLGQRVRGEEGVVLVGQMTAYLRQYAQQVNADLTVYPHLVSSSLNLEDCMEAAKAVSAALDVAQRQHFPNSKSPYLETCKQAAKDVSEALYHVTERHYPVFQTM